MSIGNKIKLLREQNCLSQRDLAFKCNVSQTTIAMYENDKVLYMNKELIKFIAKLFNADYNYILEKDYDTENENYIIGTMLAYLRKQHKMTQTYLSDLVDSSRSTISRIEIGAVDIRKSVHKELKENIIIIFPELENYINDLSKEIA